MSPKANHTIALLTSALKEKGDFPALSSDMTKILRAMREDEGSTDAALVNLILSDFALTQKVLRLANSAMYGSFGRAISTVSAAVFVLGLETVGHLAMGLKLMDNLTTAADTERARTELTKSVISGAVSRKVGSEVFHRDGESLAVTSLMRDLGKMLVCFYLPSVFDEISTKKPTMDTEEAIALDVMGLSYDDIAEFASKQWKLPRELTVLMSASAAHGDEQATWAQAVADYSRRYVSAVSTGANEADLATLASTYAEKLGTDAAALANTAKAAVVEVTSEEGKQLYRDAIKGSGKVAETVLESTLAIAVSVSSDVENEKLKAGLQEVHAAKEKLKPASLIGFATEKIVAGLNSSRFMMFLHNRATNTYDLMMGRGDGVAEQLRKLSFPADYHPNVVHFALQKSIPVYLHDLVDPGIGKRMPDWLSQQVAPSRSMLLIPLSAGATPTGLLVMDWKDGKSAALTGKELAHLEEFRVLMNRAMKEIRGV